MPSDTTGREHVETELLQKNRALRMLSGANQALIHAPDEVSLLDKVCKILAETGGYRLAWVGFAESDAEKSIRPAAYAGTDSGYLELLKLTWADAPRGRGPSGAAIRTGKPSISRDISTDPAMAPWKEEALKRGYRSSIALPLMSGGKPFGMLAVYSIEPDAFLGEELEILEELADDLSFGIVSRRAEMERRSLEERFKIIFDNTTDGIILVDPDSTRFMLGNKAICTMLGYTPEELTALSVADIHPKESLPYVQEQFGKQMRGEITLARNIPVKRKDGGVFYADVNTSAPTEFQGKKYSVGIFRDITAQRIAEKEKEQFFKFFQIATDIMVIADPNGAFKKVNPACLQILGYAEEELLAKPFIDFVHPDDKQSTLDEMARQINIGSSLDFENRYMRKDGSSLWLSWRATYDKNDGITYAIARDITERKEAEKKWKEHLEEIENINKLMVGRELKMIELKNELEALKRKASPQ